MQPSNFHLNHTSKVQLELRCGAVEEEKKQPQSREYAKNRSPPQGEHPNKFDHLV